MLDPEETFIGTLNEDFAIESMAGDVFQLGNASWRILQVTRGTVRVVDAHGRVFGIDGLRVVDASIMPTSVRSNTNLTVIMMAERVASWMATET